TACGLRLVGGLLPAQPAVTPFQRERPAAAGAFALAARVTMSKYGAGRASASAENSPGQAVHAALRTMQNLSRRHVTQAAENDRPSASEPRAGRPRLPRPADPGRHRRV